MSEGNFLGSIYDWFVSLCGTLGTLDCRMTQGVAILLSMVILLLVCAAVAVTIAVAVFSPVDSAIFEVKDLNPRSRHEARNSHRWDLYHVWLDKVAPPLRLHLASLRLLQVHLDWLLTDEAAQTIWIIFDTGSRVVAQLQEKPELNDAFSSALYDCLERAAQATRAYAAIVRRGAPLMRTPTAEITKYRELLDALAWEVTQLQEHVLPRTATLLKKT